MLPLNRLIYQKGPFKKLVIIFESTRLHYTMKFTDEALSQDEPQRAVMGSRMKPTYQCEAAYLHWAPMKVMKEAHLRSAKKPIHGAEQLHYPSTSTAEILYTTELNAPRIWRTLQFKVPMMTSTMKYHLRGRIIPKQAMHYCPSAPKYTASEQNIETTAIWLPMQFQTRYRTTAIHVLNWSRMRLNWTTKRTELPTEWYHEWRSTITTMRWTPRSHCTRYHYRTTSHGDEEDFRKLQCTKRLTLTLTKWRTEGSRDYRWTAYRSKCQTTFPEAYQMTTKKQTDILPKLPTEMSTEKSTNNKPKLSSKWLSPRSGPPRPYRMPNQEMGRPANTMYKATFPEQKRSWYIVSMTYREGNMLYMDQWYATCAWCN